VHQGRMVDVSRVVFAEDPGLKAEGALRHASAALTSR
jgi:hypothetical protein